MMIASSLRLFCAILILPGLDLAAAPDPALSGVPRWWKGNLHTHSLWSDGDDYPEMIVDWYKRHDYQFLALSDHNILLQGDKWISATTNKGGPAALEK